MFGLSQKEKLIKKMKRSGITATGQISDISEHSLREIFLSMQEATGIELPPFMLSTENDDERSITVTVTYRTKEGTEEKMYLGTKDGADKYHVGSPYKVRYIYEKKKKSYFAIPESEIKP